MGDPSVRAFTLTGWFQLIAVIAIIVFALFVNRVLGGVTSAEPTMASSARVINVSTLVPNVQPVTIEVNTTGTVEARSIVSVAPQVSGRVVSVSSDFMSGGEFKTDQVLFRIEATDFELAVNRALADLEMAQSSLQLEYAERDTATREWNLVNPNEPIPDLVARIPQIAQAEANVRSAEARLADAETALSRTAIKMPFDGRVLEAHLDIGQFVSPSASYGQVYRKEALEIRIAISNEELRQLHPVVGRAVYITGYSDGSELAKSGTVLMTEASLNSRSRQSGAIVGFVEPVEFLPGTFTSVTLEGPTIQHAFQIPASAVSPSGQVWVVSNKTLRRRTPEILMRTDSLVTTRPFDVAQGIVTTPLPGPTEGMPVSVSSPPSPKAVEL